MPPRETSQTPGAGMRTRSRQNTPAPAPPSTTKQKPTALPAATVGTSSGYGAPGKPIIRSQIATSSTSLTSVLQNVRAKTPSRAQLAINEEDEEEDEEPDEPQPPRRGPGRPRNGSRPQSAQPPPPELEREPAFNGNSMRPPTLRPPPQRPAGMLPANTVANGVRDQSEMGRNATMIDHQAPYGGVGGARGQGGDGGGIPAGQPGNLEIARNTIPRYFPAAVRDFNKDAWSLFRAIAYLLLLLSLSAFLVSAFISVVWGFYLLLTKAAFWAPIGESLFYQMNRRLGDHPYSLPPSELEKMWLEFRSEWSIKHMYDMTDDSSFNKTRLDMIQSALLDSHRVRIEALEKQGQMNEKSLKHLEAILPKHLVVREIDGQWEIPEPFWKALEARLLGDDSGALWQTFMHTNEKQLRSMSEVHVGEAFDRAASDGHMISRQMFAESVAKNYEWMDANFKDEVRKIEHQMTRNIRQIAAESATDIIQQTQTKLFTSKELEMLAKANQIHNTYQALRQVNFFSPGLGARADPHRSSPTYEKSDSLITRWFYSPHPPVAALQRWEEATDCWCASPSTELGRAQLTVKMNHLIFPQKLIVEHIPHEGTLNISTAPRELEIWIERLPTSTSTTEQLREAVHEFWPYFECGPAPSEEHICVGKGGYDIHTQNYVQYVPMAVNTEELGLAAKSVTVRVTKNWGGEATCLYRLRMTGQRVDVGS